jgi:hypothetical protein
VWITKLGGYIGLNEKIWIKTPLPAEVVEYLSSSYFGAKIETSETWEKLLVAAGLNEPFVKTYSLTALSDSINRIRWLGFREILLTWSRLLFMYLSGSSSRREIKKMMLLIQNFPKNLYEFCGYGIYVGRIKGQEAFLHGWGSDFSNRLLGVVWVATVNPHPIYLDGTAGRGVVYARPESRRA